MIKSEMVRPFEAKHIGEASDGFAEFSGYGSVFGDLDSYRDVVLPGAFKDSLKRFEAKGRPVPMLWQHRAAEPIGVYSEVREDAHGLFVKGQLNLEVQKGREAYSLMKQRALSGLSIGYSTIREKILEEKNQRELLEVDLWEISPVTFPASDPSRIDAVKSVQTLSDCEALLREAGMSVSEAKLVVSRIKAIARQREVGDAAAESIKQALAILQGVSQ